VRLCRADVGTADSLLRALVGRRGIDAVVLR